MSLSLISCSFVDFVANHFFFFRVLPWIPWPKTKESHMGLLVDGKWHDQWYDTDKTGGKFEREAARFRNWVTPDGSAGPAGEGGFAAESGRYHLYVSMACPWAHRTLIFRKLKGLEPHIGVSVVHPDMVENGWEFRPGDAEHQDHLYNSEFMHQVYTRAAADYSGRVTVPVLWDKQQETIVSNESADIIRMFNSAFNELDGVNADMDLYPESLRSEIEAINERVYDTVNNGVYKAGFATAQRSEEHTSELQSRPHLVCRLLLEKKKKNNNRM